MVNFKKHIGLNSGFNSTFARRSSGIAPSNTVAPEITGTLEVGQTLTCSTGTWTGTAPITYSYQWYRGVTPIGSDQNTYIVVTADTEQTITCTVTATNAYGSDDATSNGVVIDFYIGNSFLFDGVNERFTIPQANLQSTITDSGGTWSISVMVKRSSIGTNQCLFGKNGNSVYFRFDATNQIRFGVVTPTPVTTTSLITTNDFTDLNKWLFITFTMNQNLAAGSCGQIYVNGVLQTYSNNNIGNSIQPQTAVWTVGSQTSFVQYFNGYIQSLSVQDKVLSLAEHQDYYNNGKPKNPQDLFGANNKYFFNADNSGNTAQFSVVDSINTITATSLNMEDADKTTETPY